MNEMLKDYLEKHREYTGVDIQSTRFDGHLCYVKFESKEDDIGYSSETIDVWAMLAFVYETKI